MTARTAGIPRHFRGGWRVGAYPASHRRAAHVGHDALGARLCGRGGHALGLSQYLVDPRDGLTKALEIAARIAANPPLSNFAILQGLPRVARADPEVGLLLESLLVSFVRSDGEAAKRLRSFLEKRAPKVAQPDGTARSGRPPCE
jgi:enoyl-CoA hydratase/carnithine racemase